MDQKILDQLSIVTELVGDAEFPAALTLFLKSQVNFDRLSMDMVVGIDRPIPVYDNCPADEYDIYTARYLEGPYRQDPVWQYCQRNIAPKFYALNDFTPDGFTNTAFYKNYYIATEVIDEIGFICPISPDKTLTLSMVRRRKQRPFSDHDIKNLRPLAKLLFSLLRTHWRLQDQAIQSPSSNQQIGDILDTAFKTFGHAILTPREQAVVILILQGHASPDIASRLGITTGTVKNHRKAVYRKLDITTYAELFSLFIMSLRKVKEAVAADPVVLLENKAIQYSANKKADV